MNRAEQRRRTREALLEAAAQEFVTRGYARATLQGAADRLGLTRGTVLFHYKSKDALRDALIEWSDAQLAATVGAVDSGDLGEQDRPFVATLVDIAELYFADVRIRAGVALQEERDREHPVVPAWRAALDSHATSFLARRQHAGLADGERNATVEAVALTSMFLGIVRDTTWRTERQLRQAVDFFTSLILTG